MFTLLVDFNNDGVFFISYLNQNFDYDFYIVINILSLPYKLLSPD